MGVARTRLRTPRPLSNVERTTVGGPSMLFTPGNPRAVRPCLQPWLPATTALRPCLPWLPPARRWRWGTDGEGASVRESNARFVRWSDGSLQLLVGDEVLDVKEIDTT